MNSKGKRTSGSLDITAIPPIAVSLYVVALGFPVYWKISLIILAAGGFFAAMNSSNLRFSPFPTLDYLVIFFLLSTCVSIITSLHMLKSAEYSLVFIPALLLYFLITRSFLRFQHFYWLYIALTILAFAIAFLLLQVTWENPDLSTASWTNLLGSPLIVVPNDIIILSVLVPFSLVLLARKYHILVRAIASLSILASIVTIIIFQSRGAFLTLIITTAITLWFLNPRRIMIGMLMLVLLVLAIDSINAFSLLDRFSQVWTTRIPLWWSAWQMFLDAPLLGQGTRTFANLHREYIAVFPAPEGMRLDIRVSPWTHNLYLEILAEQGIVGLFALMAMLIVGLSLFAHPNRADSCAWHLVTAAVASLSGIVFAGLFELSFLRLWVVVMTFIILGIIASTRTWQQS